jgi:N-acetylglucosaminyl-diphospho-decaprenol L-rhamnosyltransferase
MSVAIVIVNYKTAQLTVDCLHSLVAERQADNFKVVVVDNDSQDGSVEKINAVITQQGWTLWAKVVAADYNGGFSYGNNFAIRQLLHDSDVPDYIHLLNSDTVVKPGAIRELVAFLDNNPQAGIAGSRLLSVEGSLYHASFQFHSFWTELDRGFSFNLLSKLLRPWVREYSHPAIASLTDWVAGASMMIRSKVFADIGLMDESYFLYYEEMDFCLQAKRAGWSCWHVPESVVVHFEGSTTGVNNSQSKTKRRPQYWFDSRHRFFVKNYGPIHAALADIAWLAGFGTWKLRNFFQNKPDTHPEHFWVDSFLNSVFVRRFTILPTKNS